MGSESAINDNLPLGETSQATEITRIEAVLLTPPHQMAGWLYTTRNGTRFVQSSSQHALAVVLNKAGDKPLALQVENGTRGAYFTLPANVGNFLRRASSREVILASCYGTGR